MAIDIIQAATGLAILAATYLLFFRKKSKSSDEDEFLKNRASTTNIQQKKPVKVNNRNFVQRMENSSRQMVVLYGSQTGTGEEFAYRISQNGRRYGLASLVCNPEDIDYEELENLSSSEVENPVIVMCLATYGEGEPTDNFQEMYDWLMDEERENDMLAGCFFAIFGLGNRTYEYFNAMGTKVDKRLAELGCNRLHTVGLGDDNDNIEEHFVKWQEDLWQKVADKFDFDPTKIDQSEQNIYKLENIDESSDIYTGEPYRLGSYTKQVKPFQANKNPYLSKVAVHRSPLADGKIGDRNYMHVDFDVDGSGLRYESGDHLAILAPNCQKVVNRLLNLLDINNPDEKISLTALDEEAPKKHPFPCPTSWRVAFTNYLDITNPPRTNILQGLIPFCTNEAEQTRLKAFTKVGSKEYDDFVFKSRRSIVDLLEAFPSCQARPDVVAQLLPRLQPRYYSISSSFRVSSTKIGICCVEVDYTGASGNQVKGVATGYLANLKSAVETGVKVPVWVRRSQFKLPFRTKFPVIMIGPGTGIAPFRGFLQEREWAKNKGKEVGENHLYTGFRKSGESYLYETELEGWKANGVLDGLRVAFSRDNPDEKVYVQNLMQEDREKLWELLDKGAYVYVCGDAGGMANEVQRVLKEIIAEKKSGMSSADDYMKTMRHKGRYCEDVWS